MPQAEDYSPEKPQNIDLRESHFAHLDQIEEEKIELRISGDNED